MTEEFEFDKLGFLRTFALEDPRSREISRLAVEEVGKICIDAAGWAWSTIQKSLSRPPAVKVPPPTAAAIPSPEEATVAPAREGRHGTLSLVERDPWEAATDDRTQGHGPEPLEMVGGVDPIGGGQIFAAIRKRPE